MSSIVENPSRQQRSFCCLKLLKIAVRDYNMNRLKYAPMNTWDVSKMKSMAGLFAHMTDFNEDISNWNVSLVSNMSNMFEGATSFNQCLNSWNVQNVKIMSGMFKDATSFNKPLNDWNVQYVMTMAGMFKGARSFNQPLFKWNVENCCNMSSMFEDASMFNQPLHTWVNINMKFRDNMFLNATSFVPPLVWTIMKRDLACEVPINNYNNLTNHVTLESVYDPIPEDETIFDIFAQEDVKVVEYLQQDPDNVVFYLKSGGKLLPDVVSQRKNLEMICYNRRKGNASQYCDLRSVGSISCGVVLYSELLHVFCDKSTNVFILEDTNTKKFNQHNQSSCAILKLMKRNIGAKIDRGVIDLTSSDEESEEIVFLNALNITRKICRDV